MNIKSLLLGSAAALVAVSGARAADVIMVEPEPVNYVRVCDVYGTGFFYIPGTETCMRISGQVRLQINAAGSPTRNFEGDSYETGTRVRARVNLDIREETELGLLRAYVRLQAQNNSISRGGFGADGITPLRSGDGLNAGFTMPQAYVQLGGLLLGYRDSLWVNDVGGFESGLGTDTDLKLGDVSTNQVSYTFASGGLSATIGLEDDGTGDVVPDVHGKLVYSGAWGGAFFSAVYDETTNTEDFGPFGFNPTVTRTGLTGPFVLGGNPIGIAGLSPLRVDGSNDAVALKAGAKLRDLLVEGSQLSVEGSYAFDPTVYSTVPGIGNAFSVDPGSSQTVLNPAPGAIPLYVEWSLSAGYRQSVGDFSVAVSGQYGELFDSAVVTGFNPATGAIAAGVASGDYYTLVGNLGYNFTNNFGALAEVQYTDVDLGPVGSVDQTRGFLRFVRSF